MPDRSKTRPRDPNELAHRIFLESIGEAEVTAPPEVKAKNPHAVALGRISKETLADRGKSSEGEMVKAQRINPPTLFG